MVSKELLSEGPVFSVYIIHEDNESEVGEFIDSLKSPDAGQFAHRLEVLNTIGIPRNEEQFKNEGDEIYALKTKNARFYGFFDGEKVFVLAVGFKKHGSGGKRVERRHHQRAVVLREKLRQSMSQGGSGHGS